MSPGSYPALLLGNQECYAFTVTNCGGFTSDVPRNRGAQIGMTSMNSMDAILLVKSAISGLVTSSCSSGGSL